MRSKLVATSEANRLYLTIEGEMILQGHDAEHACRWWEEVEFHSQRLPFSTQNFPNQNASKRDPSIYLGDAFAPRAGDAGACSSTT